MACPDICWKCTWIARSLALDAFHPHFDSGRSPAPKQCIRLSSFTASAKASRNSNSSCSLAERGRFPKLQQRHSIKRLAFFVPSQRRPLRLSNQFRSSLFRFCFPKSGTCETDRINDKALYTCYFAGWCGVIAGKEAQLGPYCRSKIDQAVYRPRRFERLVSQTSFCRIPADVVEADKRISCKLSSNSHSSWLGYSCIELLPQILLHFSRIISIMSAFALIFGISLTPRTTTTFTLDFRYAGRLLQNVSVLLSHAMMTCI